MMSVALAMIVQRVPVPESLATLAPKRTLVRVDNRVRAQILQQPESLGTLRTWVRQLGWNAGTVIGVAGNVGVTGNVRVTGNVSVTGNMGVTGNVVVVFGRGRFADRDGNQGHRIQLGGLCVGYVQRFHFGRELLGVFFRSAAAAVKGRFFPNKFQFK